MEVPRLVVCRTPNLERHRNTKGAGSRLDLFVLEMTGRVLGTQAVNSPLSLPQAVAWEMVYQHLGHHRTHKNPLSHPASPMLSLTIRTSTDQTTRLRAHLITSHPLLLSHPLLTNHPFLMGHTRLLPDHRRACSPNRPSLTSSVRYPIILLNNRHLSRRRRSCRCRHLGPVHRPRLTKVAHCRSYRRSRLSWSRFQERNWRTLGTSLLRVLLVAPTADKIVENLTIHTRITVSETALSRLT